MRWVCHGPMLVVGIVMMKYMILKKFRPLVGDILKYSKDCFNHLDVKHNYVPEMTGMWGMINPPRITKQCTYTSI